MTEQFFSECSPPLKSLYSRIQERSVFPLVSMIQLTDRCNLSCRHCLEPHNMYKNSELTTGQWFKVLKELADAGTLMLSVSGGEPGLRKDFFEIINEAKRLNFSIALKSSATLFTVKDVLRLWESGVTKLDVSIYSHIPEDHDKFVGKTGAFELTVKALRIFKNAGGIARANMIAMNWNFKSVTPFIDMCINEGWRYSVDSRVQPRVDGGKQPIAFRPEEAQIVDVLSDKRLIEDVPKTPDRDMDAPVCGAGKTMTVIRPNGDVWPCSVWPRVLGNILETPYSEICNIDKNPVLRAIDNLKWSDSKKCSNCSLADYCDRCPASGDLEHGNFTEPGSVDCVLASAYKKIDDIKNRG
ncbi:MAG: radical SAM protein [Deltaproteobacteria bacterium]|nr:radical SAM protein [Deltaproteobacteria bacterium]